MIETTEHTPSRRDVGERLQVWQGRSGRRYMHAVYPADRCPDVEGAVYVSVSRDAAGGHRPLAIDGTEGFASAGREASARSIWPGGSAIDEVHVHFVASTRNAVRKVIEDLRAQYDLCGSPA
jgi:hypothetical protein